MGSQTAADVVLALVAVGISVSTLFVKQHYAVDVVYGFALAWIAWRLESEMSSPSSRSQLSAGERLLNTERSEHSSPSGGNRCVRHS